LEQGQRIVLTANPNYWRGRPKLDRIELVFYRNNQDLLDAYKRGEIDLAADIGAADATAIEADPVLAKEFLRYPAAMTYAIGFNHARKPFDDKNVRIAFSQALDRENWIRLVSDGNGKPYTRWIPPGVPGAVSKKPGVPGYDPLAAVRTLAESGYASPESTTEAPKVDCAKLGEIRLTFVNSPLNLLRFQFLADNWSRVLGCSMKLDPVEAAAWKMPKDPKSRPQVFFQGYLGDYPHPQNWLSQYWTCNTTFSQRAGFCNKNLDAVLSKADQEPDPTKAVELYQQAEDLLLEDVPAAFLNYGENLYLVKPYVLGPREHIGSGDIEWAGESGPVWTYDIDLRRVPVTYPRK
jgi:oligopeptide transport system substrate-binding protein